MFPYGISILPSPSISKWKFNSQANSVKISIIENMEMTQRYQLSKNHEMEGKQTYRMSMQMSN